MYDDEYRPGSIDTLHGGIEKYLNRVRFFFHNLVEGLDHCSKQHSIFQSTQRFLRNGTRVTSGPVDVYRLTIAIGIEGEKV